MMFLWFKQSLNFFNFVLSAHLCISNLSSNVVLISIHQVLDEIHHQSMSLSLSTLSLPAPESVVDAFPLKYYRKNKNVESDSTDVRQ